MHLLTVLAFFYQMKEVGADYYNQFIIILNFTLASIYLLLFIIIIIRVN